jgi:uncharacterized protein involved in type VI secretion and phage assembly
MNGEVTAVEVELSGGATYTLVRGYDQSHRLCRGRSTFSYVNMTYSDVASKVASRAGLDPGKIDSTAPTHPHITQANESDSDFLNRLAREVGFEVTVRDGMLNFAAPESASGAPPAGDLRTDDPLRLLVGDALLDLRGIVTAAEQVSSVEVRGWDQRSKRAIVASSDPETDTVKNGSTTADVSRAFGSSTIVANAVPVDSDREASLAAKALAERVAASHTELEGVSLGNPRLRAGVAVQIGLVGEPFDGAYVLTSARHIYDAAEGYRTSFVISGRRERSTLALAGGSDDSGLIPTVNGVATAIVEDAADPDKLGRVRLRFPWLSDDYVSDWCRVSHPGAGGSRGLVVVPEAGDEVLVAFEQGDLRRPFVLGGLFNDHDRPHLGPGSFVDESSRKINNRVFTSRRGHQLLFVDASGHESVIIQTANRKMTINLDQAEGRLSIHSDGELAITAGGDLSIKAGGELKLSGRTVSSESDTDTTMKAGTQLSMSAAAALAVSGQPIQLN